MGAFFFLHKLQYFVYAVIFHDDGTPECAGTNWQVIDGVANRLDSEVWVLCWSFARRNPLQRAMQVTTGPVEGLRIKLKCKNMVSIEEAVAEFNQAVKVFESLSQSMPGKKSVRDFISRADLDNLK
jgi:hypothetical protein